MRKDSVYAQELAAEKGIQLPQRCRPSIMDRLCREGHAEEDFSCLAEQFD